jgi:site-specific DNA-methyltransferase (adenine-specific)
VEINFGGVQVKSKKDTINTAQDIVQIRDIYKKKKYNIVHDSNSGILVCGDCLELMKELPDGCVDAVVTDPPYGICESNEKNATRGCLAATTDFGTYEWDKQKVSDNYIVELTRISKNQVVFGGNYYGRILGDTSCYIVWDKDNGFSDFADCELAWTSFKKATRKIRYRWQGFLQERMGAKREIRVHPTQKPVGVMAWIIENYTRPSDIILDPFIGSGTTAVAAIRTGRQFIGFEIDPHYCEIANRRIADEQAKIPIPFVEYEKPEQLKVDLQRGVT